MRIHMRKGSIFIAWAAAAALAGALTLAACGGNSSTTTTSNSNPSGSSPAVVTVGDAPMSSVLAALVTVSDVSLVNSSGTSVHLLSQSRVIELTHLGGIRAPLDLHQIPQGTYNSLSITVSAAQITYVDPTTNQITTANATIPAASATSTITLTNPLVVDDATATDIRFDFDLSKSLDLTNGVVTFTPSIAAAVARVKGEDKDHRVIYLNGTVTATSTTNNTITLQQRDTGLSVTLNVNNQTTFGDSLTLATIQVGTVLHTADELQSDGTLIALSVDATNGGQSVDNNSHVDNGLVTAVTRDTNGNLTSFNIVVRESSSESNEGKTETIEVGQGTTFKTSDQATEAGMTSFDQSQIFVGSGVWVAGTVDTTAATPSLVAVDIRPAAVNPEGELSAAVVAGSNGSFTLPLLLNANTFFANMAKITTLNADTNSNTVFDGSDANGNMLSSTTVASLTVGAPLVARGYLTVSGGVATLFCAHLHEEGGKIAF